MGGTSLVLGPLLLLTGMLLRLRFDFFLPAQLSAYGHLPGLMTAAYSCVSAGWVLLWPGVVHLAAEVGERFRELAVWGGALTVLGLFARAFHAGVGHLAFQLVAVQGAASATRTVSETYGAFHIFSTLNAAVMGGRLLPEYVNPFGTSGGLGSARGIVMGARVLSRPGRHHPEGSPPSLIQD